MINLTDAVSLLRAKREELVRLLDGVDSALAALLAVSVPATAIFEANPQATTAKMESAVLPTRLKPPRVLSDEHKHALREGRRKARHSKDAAAGLARELPAPALGQAAASSEGRQPRLVKRLKREE